MNIIEPSRALYDPSDDHTPKLIAPVGINEEVVRLISKTKDEPEWMLNLRLKALKLFQETEMPNFGPSLKSLNLQEITYFINPDAEEATKWEDVPDEI